MDHRNPAIASPRDSDARPPGLVSGEGGGEPERLSVWVWAVPIAILAAVGGVLLWRDGSHFLALLRFPYEWDEDEGFAIYFAQRILAGKTIYGDMNSLPMMSAIYPPVHHAIVALFVAGLGGTLQAGRLVSMLATAGTCAVAVAAVAQETRRWTLVLLAAVLVLGSSYVVVWGPLARADSLMVFLLMAGFLLVRQYPRSRAALVLGLLLLLAACYTKYQAAILVPAAFWHILRHNRRAAVLSAACFGVAGLAVLAWLTRWSGGWFWQNTVSVLATQYDMELFRDKAYDFLITHPLVIAGGLGWLACCLYGRRLDLWGAFAAMSILIVLSAAHAGSAINYFLPPILAGAIGTCLVADRLVQALPVRWTARATWVLALGLLVRGAVWTDSIRTPAAADQEAGDRILGFVRAVQGDVLTERRIMFSILAGREPQMDFCLLYFVNEADRHAAAEAAKGGRAGEAVRRWDPAEIVRAIREKRYPLFVFAGELIPPDMQEAVVRHYRPLDDRQNVMSHWRDRGAMLKIIMNNWHGENVYSLAVPFGK